jgi:hypothetical protein
MNININIGDLDASQFSAVIDLMAKRDASFEAHLLANFERLQKSSRPLGSPLFGSALVLKYVDKFFPNTRWEEFEAKMLSLLDLRQVTFAELFKYIEPRFGGLRWPELEKRLVERPVKQHLILQYRDMVDWEDPRCDFEKPSILNCSGKVFKVSRERKMERSMTLSEVLFMYVEAEDVDDAENIADSFDKDGNEWEIDEDYTEDQPTDPRWQPGYNYEFGPLEVELIEDRTTLPADQTIYNASNVPPDRDEDD